MAFSKQTAPDRWEVDLNAPDKSELAVEVRMDRETVDRMVARATRGGQSPEDIASVISGVLITYAVGGQPV